MKFRQSVPEFAELSKSRFSRIIEHRSSWLPEGRAPACEAGVLIAPRSQREFLEHSAPSQMLNLFVSIFPRKTLAFSHPVSTFAQKSGSSTTFSKR
jgi:hypothetical protein